MLVDWQARETRESCTIARLPLTSDQTLKKMPMTAPGRPPSWESVPLSSCSCWLASDERRQAERMLSVSLSALVCASLAPSREPESSRAARVHLEPTGASGAWTPGEFGLRAELTCCGSFRESGCACCSPAIIISCYRLNKTCSLHLSTEDSSWCVDSELEWPVGRQRESTRA